MSDKLIKSIKGINDILPEDVEILQNLEKVIYNIANQYCISEIRLPLLEKTELFKRSIGIGSEIVEKEMYTFEDNNGELISLRPEGTASCVRCALENNLIYDRGIKKKKYWYHGPMFRYENPQRGRFRQFYQFGFEYFGFSNIDNDVELISLCKRLFISKLDLTNIKLHINSIGNKEDRVKYAETISTFLKKYKNDLNQIQKNTLVRNPMRLLDSKDKKIQNILTDLPKFINVMSDHSRVRFESILEKLDELKIKYYVDNSIVRGLDYYNDTVFEWKHSSLGSQDAVCAGGRYDELVKEIGGVSVPAMGFAFGVERLLDLIRDNKKLSYTRPRILLINISKENSYKYFLKFEELRDKYHAIKFYNYNVDENSSLRAALQFGSKNLNCKYAVIIGDSELSDNLYTLKEFHAKNEDKKISQNELDKILKDINNG
ncbi:MAG: histidine--tRNA ligase [Gammaproteobacteria bacterium]|nr:histidine--tRNA ligase [Gammaproteobacteria bacterium]